MSNTKERIGEEKETVDLFAGKDFNKAGKKKKNRREKDTIRRMTKEFLKDWRGVDFEVDFEEEA